MASIFRKVTENWKLKTLALALAVLLWVVVSSEQVTSNWIPVPLEIQVMDANYQALPAEVQDVEVRFTGTGRELLNVAVRRPPLRLTIPRVTGDSEIFELTPQMVQLAGQVAVTPSEVRPNALRLNFARLATRQVPVRPRVTDSLGSEWAVLDSLSVDPEYVEVSGPAARVARIAEIFTDSFELTPADTIVSRAVGLDTAGLAGLELSTRQANVSGRVDRVIDRTLPNVRVDVGPGINILPDRVEVQLRGPDRAVRSVAPSLFRVVVAIDEIPAYIPPEGIPVPLRVDDLRRGIIATMNPPEARLYPAQVDPDTLRVVGPHPEGVDSVPPSGPANGA
jgi:YbbR domain-containing protein